MKCGKNVFLKCVTRGKSNAILIVVNSVDQYRNRTKRSVKDERRITIIRISRGQFDATPRIPLAATLLLGVIVKIAIFREVLQFFFGPAANFLAPFFKRLRHDGITSLQFGHFS